MSEMSMKIVSAGAITNLGLSLPTTTAALRAGLDRFQETAFNDELNEPIIGAPVTPRITSYKNQERTGGKTHLSKLLTLAIDECLIKANIPLPLPTSIPILFLGDDTRSNTLVETVTLCLSKVQELIQPDDSNSRIIQVFTQGEVSCVHALNAAKNYLIQGAPFALIASADSWLNVSDIEDLLKQQRLLTSQNTAGFIPGEGAAAILLTLQDIKQDTPAIVLNGLGIGLEKAELFSDIPCYGIGMANAIKEALIQANIPIHAIDFRLSDLSGEEYFFEEAAYAWARLLRQSQPVGHQHITPATSVGNIGCAFGPLLIAYLWQLLANKRLPAKNILIHLSSAQPERGAILLKVAH